MKIISRVRSLLLIIIFAAPSLLLNSCYPDYGLTINDYDIVATFKDDSANFQNYRTYFMPDSIKRVFEGSLGSQINTQYDDRILQEIENQMLAYGYEKVINESEADVSVYVGITSSENVVYYPGYWWGYYGWYYPWYGAGYAYSYTTGSLFVTMIDRDKFDQANKILGAVWAGAANGVIDDTYANIYSRVVTSIDKMFEQSPYLKIVE